MEVRFENGWGCGWVLDPRAVLDPWVLSLFQQSDTRSRHIDMVPPVDVIEDKDGYRFYFEMLGLTNELIDACVENGRLVVAAERKRPAWPAETEVHVTEGEY